jgi:ABC-type uncharacterized transport system permease subunit
MPDSSLYFITALLYAVLAFSAWNRNGLGAMRPDGSAERFNLQAWQKLAIPGVLALHGILLYRSAFGTSGINLSLGNAVSLIVWVTVLIYWLGSFYFRLGVLQTLILSISAICVILPWLLPAAKPLDYSGMTAFKVHLVMSVLAYSLFTIAALHAGLMAIVEKRLHRGNLPALLRDLPPLMAMETLLFRMILTGFVLLTLTLISGVFFSEALFDKPFELNQKNVFGFLSWAIFGALLAGRWVYGWRGRTAVRWTLAGFTVLLFAYVGSKLLLEVLMQHP